MKKTFFVSILLSSFLFAWSAGTFNLVPAPQVMHEAKGSFKLARKGDIFVSPELKTTGAHQVCMELAQRFDKEWNIRRDNADKCRVKVQLVAKDKALPDLYQTQGYKLSVSPDQIMIEAPSEQGCFYGLQTLRQIIRTSTEKKIPCVRIVDYPIIGMRGFSDDISRGQISNMNHFRQILEHCGYFKLNNYQLYIEDSFEFAVSPNVGKDHGRLSKAEMAELVAIAKEYHITFTPVFECLGHQDRLLSLQENRLFAELSGPDQEPWSFCPTDPKAIDFVKKLIDEMVIATTSPYFHIGGDESADVGSGRSKEAVEASSKGEVHARYFSMLIDHIQKKYNRETMLYSDMLLRHPEALDFMNKDGIIIDWQYFRKDRTYPSLKTLKDAGFKKIVASPGCWNWSTFYPDFHLAFKNALDFGKAAKNENVWGFFNSSWGDNGAECIRESNWPTYALTAAVSWQKKNPEQGAFLKDFCATYYGMHDEEIPRIMEKIGFLEFLERHVPGSMFHQHLRIQLLDPSDVQRYEKLNDRMKEAQNLFDHSKEISSLYTKKSGNDNQLDLIQKMNLLKSAIERYRFIAQRQLAMHRISTLLAGRKISELPSCEQLEIRQILHDLIGNLISIRNNFEDSWRYFCKWKKVDYNLNRLNGQIEVLYDFLERAEDGTLATYLPRKVRTIWGPEKIPNVPSQPRTLTKKYFVRVLDLKEMPVYADLRAWGDGNISAYVNGSKIMSVRYGQMPVTINIVGYLKTGKNYLAIEGANDFGLAGVLFNSKIRYADGKEFELIADEKMKVRDDAIDGWKTSVPDGEGWNDIDVICEGVLESYRAAGW